METQDTNKRNEQGRSNPTTGPMAEQSGGQGQHEGQSNPGGTPGQQPVKDPQKQETPLGGQGVAPGGNYDSQRQHKDKPLSDDWGKGDKH